LFVEEVQLVYKIKVVQNLIKRELRPNTNVIMYTTDGEIIPEYLSCSVNEYKDG
jgi:hypothetical protein